MNPLQWWNRLSNENLRQTYSRGVAYTDPHGHIHVDQNGDNEIYTVMKTSPAQWHGLSPRSICTCHGVHYFTRHIDTVRILNSVEISIGIIGGGDVFNVSMPVFRADGSSNMISIMTCAAEARDVHAHTRDVAQTLVNTIVGPIAEMIDLFEVQSLQIPHLRLDSLPNLTCVCLEHCGLTLIPPTLSRLKHLSLIQLAHNDICMIFPPKLLYAWTDIIEIDLAHNSIENLAIANPYDATIYIEGNPIARGYGSCARGLIDISEHLQPLYSRVRNAVFTLSYILLKRNKFCRAYRFPRDLVRVIAELTWQTGHRAEWLDPVKTKK
jgi:hypothetical protein